MEDRKVYEGGYEYPAFYTQGKGSFATLSEEILGSNSNHSDDENKVSLKRKRAGQETDQGKDVTLLSSPWILGAFPCENAVSLVAFTETRDAHSSAAHHAKLKLSTAVVMPTYQAIWIGQIAPREEETVIMCQLSHDGSKLLLGMRSGWLLIYSLVPMLESFRKHLREGHDAENALERSSVPFPPLSKPESLRTFRPWHSNSVTVCTTFSADDSYFALGSSEGQVRIFDTNLGTCLHTFQVSSSARVSCLEFLPNAASSGLPGLFASAEDGSLVHFSMLKATKVNMSNHTQAVTSLCFMNSNRQLVSVGRDRLICIWDIPTHELVRNIIGEESFEAVCRFPGNPDVVVAGGESGKLTLWDCAKGSAFASTIRLAGLGSMIVKLDDLHDLNMVMVSTADQFLVLMQPNSVSEAKASKRAMNRCLTVAGNLDEVYDMRFSPHDPSIMFVVTNSHVLRGFQINPKFMERIVSADAKEASTSQQGSKLLSTLFSRYSAMEDSPRLLWPCIYNLTGHTDNLLGMDCNDKYIATSSRDKSARIYDYKKSKSIAYTEGHMDAVSSVALSNREPYFVVTGAADKTLKLWTLKDKLLSKSDNPVALTAKWTVLAHKKDINCLSVSPDSSMVASGSQDRTIKIWDASNGKMISECTGHKRGIWSLAFSPTDRILVSASGDHSLKIWNVSSGSCLRTLEGHSVGVLKVAFISHGLQVASSAADGVIKVWYVKDGACATTMDAHEGRAWALTSYDQGKLIATGGADGRLCLWQDVTKEKELEAAKQQDELVEKEQAILDATRNRNWEEAIRGSLELERPRKLLEVIQLVLSSKNADSFRTYLKHALAGDDDENEADGDTAELSELGDVQTPAKIPSKLIALLKFCRDWNTSVGTAAIAHFVLDSVFKIYPPWVLSAAWKNSSESIPLLEALASYTDKHYRRVSDLSRRVYYVDYIMHAMGGLLGQVDDKQLFSTALDQLAVAAPTANANAAIRAALSSTEPAKTNAELGENLIEKYKQAALGQEKAEESKLSAEAEEDVDTEEEEEEVTEDKDLDTDEPSAEHGPMNGTMEVLESSDSEEEPAPGMANGDISDVDDSNTSDDQEDAKRKTSTPAKKKRVVSGPRLLSSERKAGKKSSLMSSARKRLQRKVLLSRGATPKKSRGGLD